nr:unnamed protein product [Callosobruchus chinensis]
MSDSCDDLSKSEDLSFNNHSADAGSPNFVNTYNAWHEMLEAEHRSVAGRLADLERKVLEQGDELVCLKATLAEALRRLSTLEGVRSSASSIGSSGTPVKINGKDSHVSAQRQRPISYQGSNTHTPQRRAYGGGSSLPQRRAVHYQSTGSLHSDGHSSSSVSPIPSPSPRATPLPVNGARRPSNSSVVQPPPTPPCNGSSSTFSTKSFLNLFANKTSSYAAPNFKHGTRDATYNEDEKSLKCTSEAAPLSCTHPPSSRRTTR